MPAELVAELAALRPRPGSMIRYHTLLSLRGPGRRVQYPGGQLTRPGQLITPLVTARAPGLLSLFGVQVDFGPYLPGRIGPRRCGSQGPHRPQDRLKPQSPQRPLFRLALSWGADVPDGCSPLADQPRGHMHIARSPRLDK
jgi:hypothetical protein